MGYAVLIILIAFFSINMGASGFAAAMAAPYGADFLNRVQASILFTIFVLVGALTAGGGVENTLGREIVPEYLLDMRAVILIMAAAGISLFVANLLKIPQSTSQVTVGSLVGAGIYFGHVNAGPFALMLPLWVALPVLAYVLVLVMGKIFFWRVRKVVVAQGIMKRYRMLQVFVIGASCYAAYAIGSNNVANAVGPMVGAGVMGSTLGALIVSPLFGIGSITLGKGTLETAGKEITPLGVLGATLVCLVSGTLLLTASLLGMPASEVQIKLGAIFGMGVVKSGHGAMFKKKEVRKAFAVWAVAPVLSVGLSYVLFLLFGS